MKAFPLQPPGLKIDGNNFFFNRKVTGLILLFLLVTLPVGALSLINYKSESIILIVKFIQVAIFIALGIYNSSLLEKRPYFAQHSSRERFYFSLVVSLLIYGVLLLIYFIIRSDMQRMALASSCAFLLPQVTVQAWHYYLMIPDNKSMVWYGYKPDVENADIVYLNTILVNLKLSRKDLVYEEASFWINTPLNLELGKLFNSFLTVEKKNDAIGIECLNHNNEPYGWKFFAVSFGGLYKRVLDPAKSLQNNNNIKKNSVILAKRVRTR